MPPRITNLDRGAACQRCREKKLKCDAARPTCRQCARTGSECAYGHSKGNKEVQLKRKIAQLEKALGDVLLQKDSDEGGSNSSEKVDFLSELLASAPLGAVDEPEMTTPVCSASVVPVARHQLPTPAHSPSLSETASFPLANFVLPRLFFLSCPGPYDLTPVPGLVPPALAQRLINVFYYRALCSTLVPRSSFALPPTRPEHLHPALQYISEVGIVMDKGDKLWQLLVAYHVLSLGAARKDPMGVWGWHAALIKLALSMDYHRLSPVKLLTASGRASFTADNGLPSNLIPPNLALALRRTPTGHEQESAIKTWWTTYTHERVANVLCCTPCTLEEDQVTTPFYAPTPADPQPQSFRSPRPFTTHPASLPARILLRKAVCLCARAGRLNDPSLELPASLRASEPVPRSARERLAVIRESAEFEELAALVNEFRCSLPQRWTGQADPCVWNEEDMEEVERVSGLHAVAFTLLILHEPHLDSHPSSAAACNTASLELVELVSQLASPRFVLGRLHVFCNFAWLRAGHHLLRSLRIARESDIWNYIGRLRAGIGLLVHALERVGETWAVAAEQSRTLRSALEEATAVLPSAGEEGLSDPVGSMRHVLEMRLAIPENEIPFRNCALHTVPIS